MSLAGLRALGGRRLLLLALVGCVLSACFSGPILFSVRRPLTPHPTYKIGAPYTVNGVTYYPRVDYGYDEIGTASWYGEGFAGQYTANGEVFDVNAITAAHTTLPLPSIVEVVNLQNNRALRIRVNDRGPFARGRIIDLSRRAAQLLGFERNGTTMVRVRVLKAESQRAAAYAERGLISNGDELVTDIAAAAAGVPAAMQAAVAPAPRRHYFVTAPLYHVQAGPFASQQEADRLLSQMTASGYRDARIVID